MEWVEGPRVYGEGGHAESWIDEGRCGRQSWMAINGSLWRNLTEQLKEEKGVLRKQPISCFFFIYIVHGVNAKKIKRTLQSGTAGFRKGQIDLYSIMRLQ